MGLKIEKVKLAESVTFQGEEVKEVEVRELSAAGQLRINSTTNLDLSVVYGESVFPKGILEEMDRKATKVNLPLILEAYMKVNEVVSTPTRS